MAIKLILARLTGIALPAVLFSTGCGPNPPGDGNPCPPGNTGGLTTVSYSNDIVPLFSATRCSSSACHGGMFPSSRYDLRTYATAFVSGDEADMLGVCEIVPGKPESSYMIEKLRSSDPRIGLQMPLEGEPLSEAQIVLIETWIREGAQDN